MKISKIIKTVERYNSISNNLIKPIEIKDIPIDLVEKTKSQNTMLENLFNEFNMDKNSFVYKFTNTQDNRVKTIVFENPLYIKNASLKIDDFIFNKLIRFKVTFFTIDNASITHYMLPYEFRGDYIEEIKFMFNQKKSNFKTVNNDKLVFYDIVKNSLGQIDLQKLKTDYSEYIDEEGYIIFNTQHKKDKLGVKYTPISSEFIKEINDKITSVTLEIDNEISNNIELEVINS